MMLDWQIDLRRTSSHCVPGSPIDGALLLLKIFRVAHSPPGICHEAVSGGVGIRQPAEHMIIRCWGVHLGTLETKLTQPLSCSTAVLTQSSKVHIPSNKSMVRLITAIPQSTSVLVGFYCCEQTP